MKHLDGGSRQKNLRVLMIQAHPRPDSFCVALADSFCKGAGEAGIELRRLNLSELSFESNVIESSPADQVLEPDLRRALDWISWADHLVFVFPTWWGSVPALLKAFLDRTLIPGFAFRHHEEGDGWDKLLSGKTAHLLTTMDTPAWVYRWIYRAPGINSLARATLGYCGIAPVRHSIFEPIKDSNAEQRSRWLHQAHAEGLKLREGALPRRQQARRKILSWIAALRLQFYPMTWSAYLLGALAATGHWQGIASERFWLGLLGLFTLEAATVFGNEYFDIESDRVNRYFGPFNGGARVLVDGRIQPAEMRMGIAIAVTAFVFVAAGLIWLSPAVAPILLAYAVLAPGYTVPPLKLSWRSLGELDVALTHSIMAVLLGFILSGGAYQSALPWLISVPVLLSIIPSITLSAVPDLDADTAAGKATLPVRFGIGKAIRLSQLATAAAIFSAILIWPIYLRHSAWVIVLACLAVTHAFYLATRLGRARKLIHRARRIDGLLLVALNFIPWFVLIPLVGLG